jgi:glycosyltransferase involved in cell wall biosynthesis
MTPQLSVIVAAQNAGDSIVACLDSLLTQEFNQVLQIIVVDGSSDNTAALVKTRFPDLYLIQRPCPSSLPHLLGVGISVAEGAVVAITEAHCTFPPDWAGRVLAAHEADPAPAIGGVVEPGPTLGWSDWALYFADYGQFMRPLHSGPVREMPGENVSFKVGALNAARRAGDSFEQTGFWKTFLCERLQQANQVLLSVAEIVVFYNRHLGITSIIVRRLTHGRCLGGMRRLQISWQRRTLIVVGGWLLPGLIFVRLWRNVWPKRRHRFKFIISLPLILIAIVAWSIGEWWGTLFGTGNSCDYV